MVQPNNSTARSLGINVAILVGVWLLGFAIVQLSGRFTTLWIGELGQFISVVLGLIVALRVNARVAAALLLISTVFLTAELTIHIAFGVRALRGGPSNLAVAIAAVIGVFGSLLLRRRADALPPAHA